jgi:hypothetical protein
MIDIRNGIFISETDLDSCNSTREHALHDLTLIKMFVIRFVGTGSFLTRYSNFHAK